MSPARSARCVVAMATLATWILGGSRATAATEALLTGMARDSLGKVLGDVEILVLSEKSLDAAASARTGSDGRYKLAGLPPGIYKIAGTKQGYAVFLGRVNTLLQSSFDLLLRPAPEPGEPGSETVPEDRSWVLRLPARSVLRDVKAQTAPVGEGAGGAKVAGPAFYEGVQGQVDHLFALGSLPSQPAVEDPELQGTETRIRLASPLGERGNVWLQGRHESLGATSETRDLGLSSTRKAAGLQLNVSYDPTSDTSLSVRSFYTSQNLWGAADAQAPSMRQSERSWGCDARWSKQIDTESRLDVGIDYQDSSLDLPGSLVATRPVLNRALGTGGAYESVAAERHRLRLGWEARLLDLPDPSLRANGDGTYLGASGPAGWNLRLNAQDAWSVSSRMSFLYGLGYSQPLEAPENAPIFVPRLGGAWSTERLRFRLLLSYHGSPVENAFLNDGPFPRRLGYEGEAQVPLPLGFLLRGEVSYAPGQYDVAQMDIGGPAFSGPGPRPVYITDGNAAARESTLSLERPSRRTTTYLQVTEGEAEGTLAVLPPFRAPVSVLANGQVRFRMSRVGVRFLPFGTDLAAEYRNIDGLPAGERQGTSRSARHYVEVRVAQDLLRLQGSGASWRLLLVARAAGGGEGDGAPGNNPGMQWAALSRELGAGVSLAF